MLKNHYIKIGNTSKTWTEAKNRIYDSSARVNAGKDWELQPVNIPKDVKFEILKDGFLKTALDLGCGLGRNFETLRNLATTVHGFDLPEVIKWTAKNKNYSADFISGQWDDFKEQKYDIVAAFASFQHMDTADARLYLKDVRIMSPLLYVAGRSWMDDKSDERDVAKFIIQCGYVEIFTTPTHSDHWHKLFQPTNLANHKVL